MLGLLAGAIFLWSTACSDLGGKIDAGLDGQDAIDGDSDGAADGGLDGEDVFDGPGDLGPDGADVLDGADRGQDAGDEDVGHCVWTASPSNPIFRSNWTSFGDLLINDPSVLRNGQDLRMWYSKGVGYDVNHVRIYSASSSDGINWYEDPTVLLEPDDNVTVTGATVAANGTYGLDGEFSADFVNGAPAYTLQGKDWYLWYDSSNGQYRLSDIRGSDGSASWLGEGGLIVDGDYIPYSGSATGNQRVSSSWDSKITETPSVIKVGNTYHMYYSGLKIGGGAAYNIGHATSTDGVTWTKDPNNPVLAHHDDVLNWGFFFVAEPGALYDPDTGTFYLYYTTNKYRGPGYEGTDFAVMQGIAVATSSDGSNFTQQGAVLTQSAYYSVADKVVGYSTPYALVDSQGRFHLFYDVAYYLQPGVWTQGALAHAVASDPFNFVEVETDIFTVGQGWIEEEVRAPCVIEEDGRFRMWFAGSNSLFFQSGFVWAIGYADSDRVCY